MELDAFKACAAYPRIRLTELPRAPDVQSKVPPLRGSACAAGG